MTSVLDNIVNNNIGGTTPSERNKWYYLALFIAILLFFFLYVKIDVSLDGKKSNHQTETVKPVITNTNTSSDGQFYHTKITKVDSSLEDQHNEMHQQFYS